MSKLMRHTGKIKNSGVRCAVIFRKLPASEGVAEDRDHALIVETDSLPDAYHENLMNVIVSEEAQQTHELYNILSRRMFVDGKQMLPTLHAQGLLRKVRVDDVVLFPFPNQPLSLRDANNAIDGVSSTTSAPEPVKEAYQTPVNVPEQEKEAVARGLIAQAELLETEAEKKRKDAYELAPHLKPTLGRPELSPEEKARRREEKNRKRREKYANEKESSVLTEGEEKMQQDIETALLKKTDA